MAANQPKKGTMAMRSFVSLFLLAGFAILLEMTMSGATSPFLSLLGSPACACPQLEGTVSDCCCDYKTVDKLNLEVRPLRASEGRETSGNCFSTACFFPRS